ncbi:MAG: GIY-YIG nuclease family protein [Prochloraceae cyanobacterium]|nr:GIY-YIG nuclease family protein [Prochloraceae cyanobacterium]
MTNTNINTQTTFSLRLPSDVMKAIETQVRQTKQSKTAVTVTMLQNAIPSLHITERFKLPARPGIYFVYTPDYQLLYIGKADNLQKRWNSHHKYQYFIETSMQCRIGYFVLNSAESLNQVIDEFKSESIETTTKALVTSDQLESVNSEVEYQLKRIDNIYSALSQVGNDSVIKKLEAYQPTRGLQQWSPSREDINEGITRGNLAKKLGFESTKTFEDAAAILGLDPNEYLSELSGWSEKPVEPGSALHQVFSQSYLKRATAHCYCKLL